MPALRIKRGTRAQLNTAAAANQLAAGEPYLITDEGRLAIGSGTGSYVAFARQPFAQTIGDGSATSFNIDHNLGTYDVLVSVFQNSGSREDRIPDVARPSVNRVTITFAAAPAASAYRVVVTG